MLICFFNVFLLCHWYLLVPQDLGIMWFVFNMFNHPLEKSDICWVTGNYPEIVIFCRSCFFRRWMMPVLLLQVYSGDGLCKVLVKRLPYWYWYQVASILLPFDLFSLVFVNRLLVIISWRHCFSMCFLWLLCRLSVSFKCLCWAPLAYLHSQ